jgi:hypothetical protein
MIEKQVVELANREVDGETTPEESTRLRQLCEARPEVRALVEELRALSAGLGTIGRAAPPATLKASVMRAVTNLSRTRQYFQRVQTHPDTRSVHPDQRRSIMAQNDTSVRKSPARSILIGGSLLAVIVIGYFALFYPPKGSQDMEGTIGKAERYKSEQMASADIALKNPEFQALLQNHIFVRAMKNENFRAAMQSEGLVALFRDAGLAAAFNTDAYRKLITDARAAKAIGDDQVRVAMGNSDLIGLLAKGDLAKVLSNDGLRTQLAANGDFARAIFADALLAAAKDGALKLALTPDMARALGTPSVIDALRSPKPADALKMNADFARAVKPDQLKQITTNENLMAVLTNDNLRGVLKENWKMLDAALPLLQSDAAKAFQNPEMLQAVFAEGNKAFWSSADLRSVVATPEGLKLFQNADFARAITDARVASVLTNPDLLSACMQGDFRTAVKTEQFSAVVGSDAFRNMMPVE